jgi:hypothetical protein
MNPNLAEVGKPTRWPPGPSGNPAGKLPGTRTAFSQGFIRDFARVWAEEGLDAVRKVAKKSPEAFVAIAARICPNDVRLTLEQAIPGGMSLEDYSLMREVIGAIIEEFARPVAITLAVIGVVVVITMIRYLRRKEQELAAAAEREIPGPLQVGK